MQGVGRGGEVRYVLTNKCQGRHCDNGEQCCHEAVFDQGLAAFFIGRRPYEPSSGPKGQILKLFHPIPPRRHAPKVRDAVTSTDS